MLSCPTATSVISCNLLNTTPVSLSVSWILNNVDWTVLSGLSLAVGVHSITSCFLLLIGIILIFTFNSRGLSSVFISLIFLMIFSNS